MRVLHLPACPHCVNGVPRDVLRPSMHRLGTGDNRASVACADMGAAAAERLADALRAAPPLPATHFCPPGR